MNETANTQKTSSTELPKTSTLVKKLVMIKNELEIMQPSTLLLTVDPSEDVREVIEQIQHYNDMINAEIKNLYSLEREEAEANKKMAAKKKQFEVVKAREKKAENIKGPQLDYRVQIKSLESEVCLMSQKVGDAKAKNLLISKELNELRRNTKFNQEKFEHINKTLKKKEKEFFEQKQMVEEINKDKEEEEILAEINKLQKEFEQKNMQIVNKIKSTDKEIQDKLAVKKYLEHEKKKLKEKNKKIDIKWENESKKFYETHRESIEKNKIFQENSKSQILEYIDNDKINEIESMLERIYEQTGLEDIDSLIKYFANCLKEYNNFEAFISTLSQNVKALENDVEELEFIINFCEQNLTQNSEKISDEEEQQKLDRIKEAAEDFGYLQYLILVEKYRTFCEKISESLSTDGKAKEVENFESVKSEIENIQLKIKELCDFISKKVKQVVKTKGSVMGIKGTQAQDNSSNLPNIDKEYSEKLSKLKLEAETFYNTHGTKLDNAKLRKLINPIVYDKDRDVLANK